ncbi:MAG: hypothetical protein HC859_10675 [Bacteroidia bacterium]|nr:hypothetical protein [Bacteroidia bacterium]
MKPYATILNVSPIQQHAIHTLLYFDIFKYPLRNQEIFKFLRTNHLDEETLRNEVEALVNAGLIHRFGEFYSISDTDDNVERRLRGNQLAALSLPVAQRQARLIARFPFVRAVMASGSLSKGYMEASSDLDFFIVTQPGRLWIARTLLVLYKRVFLGNSHKHFCVNYFVDANHLEIADKNILPPPSSPRCCRYGTLISTTSWSKQTRGCFTSFQTSSGASLKRSRLPAQVRNGALKTSLNGWAVAGSTGFV